MRTPTLALPAAGDSQVLLRRRRRRASEEKVEIDFYFVRDSLCNSSCRIGAPFLLISVYFVDILVRVSL